MQDQPRLRMCDGPEKDCFVGLAVAYCTCFHQVLLLSEPLVLQLFEDGVLQPCKIGKLMDYL